MKILKSFYHYFIAVFSAWINGCPSKELIVVGVTGTKGKSSTCRFVASALQAGGHKVGLLSTVEFQIADKRELNRQKMTMLGRGHIQSMLKKMVEAGCRYAVIETSSEGILQHRHVGIDYDICVFTNLGSEHSERHGGFANLRRDKAKIFTGLSKRKNKIIDNKEVKKIIIANGDDENFQYFLNNKSDEKWVYCFKNIAAPQHTKLITAQIEGETENGFDIKLAGGKIFSVKIPGSFNGYNALAAIAVARSQGIEDEMLANGISSVKSIEGRMEFINEGQPFKVVVDYAHEPMSLKELFSSLRKIVGQEHKVLGVIGSDGGGRDKGKRSLMGEIAGRLCDVVIITDVNCFDEDPTEIAEMLAFGARQAGKIDNKNLFIEVDRRKGIEKAISLLEAGDVAAITAKGTEPCIVAKGKKIPWDDRQVAREILNKNGYRSVYVAK